MNQFRDDRIFPYQPLPRQYPFLTRHAQRSFIVPYTYDFAASPFSTKLRVPHGLSGAAIHDMWFARAASVTGDPRKDYSPFISPIYHTPTKLFDGLTQADHYYLSVDDTYAYINIHHVSATTGTYHCYFHVKIYADEFLTDGYDGRTWRVTAPTTK